MYSVHGVLRQKVIAGVGVGLLLASLFVGTVKAADFNLTASPLPVNLNVVPGGTVTAPLRIQNTGNEVTTINVSLKKFGPSDKTGKPTIQEVGPHDEFIKWVHFSQTSFRAEPNVWYTVDMTINPSKDAAFGYYYAVVFSQENSGQKISNDKLHSKVNGAIASLILLDVNAPGEKRTLSVKQFVSTSKIYEYLPATFTVTVHNSGNVHAVPVGNIFISKNRKDTLAALQLNSAGGNVLPNSDRQFEVSWNDGFPAFQPKRVHGQVLSDDNGKPIKVLNWNGLTVDKFRFGKYYAHLLLTYNDGKRDIPVDGELSFWVIPWKALTVIIIVLLAILGMTYLSVRNVIRGSRASKKQA